MDKKPKGGDPALSIFPENRPRDETGSTPPTAADARAKSIEDARIAKEQAQIREGFANQPTAGHDQEKDQGGGRRR